MRWSWRDNWGIRQLTATANVNCHIALRFRANSADRNAIQLFMKILYLLRHAKSSWDNADLRDFERPLSDRGVNDIPVMAQRFIDRGSVIDCIVSSPAVRAKTTARAMADKLNFPKDEIISNPELYFAGTGMFLKATKLMDESANTAMLVGHNPAITEFANAMLGDGSEEIDNIPTCGLVALELPIEQWADASLASARRTLFDFPKKDDESD